IYGFRGADVRGILDFPRRFPGAGGEPAPVVALRTCRRSGPALLRASRGVARRLPAAPSPDGGPVNAHRELAPVPDAPEGEARVLTMESPTQEAAVIADVLRRAHLVDGLPWSRMAVLVRSATRQVPVLRRALLAAGVPVAVAGDELPLAAEPVVRPLLLLLRCGLHPASLDPDTAHELLVSPFGEADTVRLRRLGRALRRLELDAFAADGGPDRGAGGADPDGGPAGADRAAEEAEGGGRPRPRSSAVLIADALRDPRELTLVDPALAEPARRIARLLAAVSDTAARGGSAEDVLWEVWKASGLGDRLLRASQAGGRRGAAADRDLDAVVALFENAARYCDRLPPGTPEGFLEDLEAQEIPGDTLAEHAPEGESVRILTAHRSKGLEWDLVVVAGVQEGDGPD